MKDRRRILLADGKKPVYVFKNGDKALRIGSFHTPYGKMEIKSGCIQIGDGSGISNNYLINVDFTDFSELHFVASTGSYGDTNRIGHHSNYTDAYNRWSGVKILGKNAGKQELVFDISGYTGKRHLVFHTANTTIYDCWLI